MSHHYISVANKKHSTRRIFQLHDLDVSQISIHVHPVLDQPTVHLVATFSFLSPSAYLFVPFFVDLEQLHHLRHQPQVRGARTRPRQLRLRRRRRC